MLLRNCGHHIPRNTLIWTSTLSVTTFLLSTRNTVVVTTTTLRERRHRLLGLLFINIVFPFGHCRPTELFLVTLSFVWSVFALSAQTRSARRHNLQISFAETLMWPENKLFAPIRFYVDSFVVVLCQLNCLITGEGLFCIKMQTKSLY
jgi:hypothetical protein